MKKASPTTELIDPVACGSSGPLRAAPPPAALVSSPAASSPGGPSLASLAATKATHLPRIQSGQSSHDRSW